MEYIDAKTIVRKCNPIMDYLLFDYVMDLYRGCTHGCIYCYARSDYYEKTNNFENIRVKKDALRIVRDELRRKTRTGIMLTGGMSDCYNPVEKELKLTRNALELLDAFGFGACIITKSNLVVRDIDILTSIKENSPVSVNFSITCSDDELGKKLEPRAATTTERFETINTLSKSGIRTGVMMDPMIPFITDTEENVINMVKKAKYYGADYIYLATMVTMADGQREYFLKEAEKLFPGFSQQFIHRYKTYYRCWSYNKEKIWNTFIETCQKEKIQYDMRIVNKGIRTTQMTIFDL